MGKSNGKGAKHPQQGKKKKGGKSALAEKSSIMSSVRNMLSTVGHAVAGPAGGLVGKGVGNLIAHISGSGSYQVQGNTLLSDAGPPTFAGGRGIRFKHREYLGDLASSTVFTNWAQNSGLVKTFGGLINPGNSDLFPWLCGEARGFEEYYFHGIVVEFQSLSADALNSTNTALGSVAIATEYDVLKPLFVSMDELLSYEFATIRKPSESMLHAIECKPSEEVLKWRYVTSTESISGLPIDADPRFYYAGQIQICTQGMQAASVDIGKIAISYDVELRKPRQPSPVGVETLALHWWSSWSSGNTPLPQGPMNVASGSNMDTLVNNQTGLTFTSAGVYFVQFLVEATANFTAVTAGFVGNSTCIILGLDTSSAGVLDGTTSSLSLYSAGSASCYAIVSVTDYVPSQTAPFLTLPKFTTTGAAGGYCDLRVIQVSAGLTLSKQPRIPMTRQRLMDLLVDLQSRVDSQAAALKPTPLPRLVEVLPSKSEECGSKDTQGEDDGTFVVSGRTYDLSSPPPTPVIQRMVRSTPSLRR